jgi:leucyl-tRNA---protein transferase
VWRTAARNVHRGVGFRPVQSDCDPPEWLVYDEPGPCAYLPGLTARLPLRLPLRPLDGDELARRLEAGERRQGLLLYRPSCPTCQRCQALRLDVQAFTPSRTQRRIWRRGDALLETRLGRPQVTPERVTLYNRHKVERGLLVHDERLDAAGYREFLVESCTETIELSYRYRGRLVGVGVADRARDGLSAVYYYFDPLYGRLSPGTYSILKQVALCREWGLRYLYLGLYVVGCAAMAYKATFFPHERLIDGTWQSFDRRQS